jgi:glycerate 2-kinase
MSLRNDALRIWHAGVAAVDPQRLVREAVVVDGHWLLVEDLQFDLREVGRILVVGAGKASAAMALGLEASLAATRSGAHVNLPTLAGLLSIPAGSEVPLTHIELIAGRPAGVNEPRPAGEAAARRMMQLVASAQPNDLCLCLLSGGGSALLPLPAEGVTLTDKVAVTRLLSAAGASIEELNLVRSNLSAIKRGGLARACRAGRLVTLTLSDVLGDPVNLIASGPTVPAPAAPDEALGILRRYGLAGRSECAEVVGALSREARGEADVTAELEYRILGNNAVAVDAAGVEAERLGYNHAMLCATATEGPAEEVGRHLAETALQMRATGNPNCLISGGETTVKLADPAIRGRGGRNQQLALAALEVLGDCQDIALVSAGTDGEDGPTDAAGAILDANIARRSRLSAGHHLAQNDAYTFFEECGGLLKTGPTGTNVCDLRVVVVGGGDR